MHATLATTSYTKPFVKKISLKNSVQYATSGISQRHLLKRLAFKASFIFVHKKE